MTPVIPPRRPITPDLSRKSKIFCSFFAPKAFVTPISLVFESDFMKLMENEGIREIEITKEAPGKAEEELKEEGIKKDLEKLSNLKKFLLLLREDAELAEEDSALKQRIRCSRP